MLRQNSQADPALTQIPKPITDSHRLTRVEAFLTIVNISLGSGVTLGAHCFYKEGLMVGMVVSVFFFMVYLLTSYYFTSLIINTRSYTYEMLVRRIVGRKCELFFNLLNFSFLMLMAITQTYLILTAFHGLLVSIFGGTHFLTSQTASALYISPYLLYYSLKRRIKEMAWVSLSNMIAMLLFTTFVLIFSIKSFSPFHNKHPPSETDTPLGPTVSVVQFLGTLSIMSTFMGLPYVAAPLTYEMSHLGIKSAFQIKVWGLFVVFCMFFVISTVFVLTFGRHVLFDDSLLRVMYHKSSEGLVILAEASFVVTLITNIPYFIFLSRQSLINFCKSCTHKENPDQNPQEFEIDEEEQGLLSPDKPQVLNEGLSKCQFVCTSLSIVVVIVVIAVMVNDASGISQLVLGQIAFLVNAVEPAVLFTIQSKKKGNIVICIFLGSIQILMIVSAVLNS